MAGAGKRRRWISGLSVLHAVFALAIILGTLAASFTVADARNATRAVPVERIDDFSSDITIAPDGELTVQETVTLHAENRNIVRGLFRTYPITYRDRDGNKIHMRFHIVEVRHNRKPEPYTLLNGLDGLMVMTGSRNAQIPRGDHTYIIVYKTDRRIGFLDDIDRLDWNVTGTDLQFPISHAEAIVHLPQGAHIKDYSAYTGDKAHKRPINASAEQRAGSIRFFTTRSLQSEEGLSFGLDVAKGAVAPPDRMQKMLYFIRDNGIASSAVLGLLVLGAYYALARWRFRQPAVPSLPAFSNSGWWGYGGPAIFIASAFAAVHYSDASDSAVQVILGGILSIALVSTVLHVLGGVWGNIFALIAPRFILSMLILVPAYYALARVKTESGESFGGSVPTIAVIAFLAQGALAITLQRFLNARTPNRGITRKDIPMTLPDGERVKP